MCLSNPLTILAGPILAMSFFVINSRGFEDEDPVHDTLPAHISLFFQGMHNEAGLLRAVVCHGNISGRVWVVHLCHIGSLVCGSCPPHALLLGSSYLRLCTNGAERGFWSWRSPLFRAVYARIIQVYCSTLMSGSLHVNL
jgi:hypothetical protein